MFRTLLLVLAGLGAGLAIATWTRREAPPSAAFDTPASATAAPRGAAAPASAADVRRLDALEQLLQDEVEQRALLEQRVLDLAAELEQVRAQQPGAAGTSAAAGGAEEQRSRFGRLPEELARRIEAERADPVERFIAAGFAPDRAEWLSRRVSELRMETLQAQYNATREGRALNPFEAGRTDDTLRAELGDADYERYLSALNRPTSIGVRETLAGSPAESSGLRAGDEIVAYDGKRVFDMRELNALTLEGTPGESVAVEVLRDGQRLQLVMPRGPMGIYSGFRRGR